MDTTCSIISKIGGTLLYEELLKIWIDYRLAWNATKFENVTSVRFAGGENQIWRPDILLYNRFVVNVTSGFYLFTRAMHPSAPPCLGD